MGTRSLERAEIWCFCYIRPGLSTLMTSASRSARCWVPKGPAPYCSTATTRTTATSWFVPLDLLTGNDDALQFVRPSPIASSGVPFLEDPDAVPARRTGRAVRPPLPVRRPVPDPCPPSGAAGARGWRHRPSASGPAPRRGPGPPARRWRADGQARAAAGP